MNVCRPVPCNRRSPPALAASAPPPPTWPTGAHLLLVPTASTLNALSDGSGAAPSAPSDPVGLWEDQSGNGRDLAQTTSGIRGLWDTSPTGVTFDATFRRLVRATDGPAAGAVSIGLVFKLSAVPGVGVFFLLARLAHGSGTGISEVYLCNSAGYTAIHVRCGFSTGAGLGVGAVATLDTGEHTLLVVYDGSGSTTPGAYEIYLDGVALSVIASGSSSGLTGGVTSLGCGEDGGGTPYYPTSGTIRHLGVWARALDAGDVTLWQDQADAIVGPWTPEQPGDPAWWHEVVLGRIWQDTAGTIAATTVGDPIARVDARFGTNFTQASVSLQPYLSTVGDGLGARSDDVDDNLGNTATKSAGPGVLACIFEIFSAPSASGNETILRLGATPVQLILRHSGLSASSAKGWHIGFDRSSTSAACIQGTSPALLSVGVHTLVVRYDGVSATAASSYRIWLDGVEVTTATGGNVAATGNTRWLATSIATEVANAAVRESILWTSALSEADCIAAAAYLEAKR